jgi:hypothetical protein
MMNYKETEILKADIFGIVQFDAGEYKDAGLIEMYPLLNPSVETSGSGEISKGGDGKMQADPLQLKVRNFDPSTDSL